jgi:hypothetical protein
MFNGELKGVTPMPLPHFGPNCRAAKLQRRGHAVMAFGQQQKTVDFEDDHGRGFLKMGNVIRDLVRIQIGAASLQ